MSERVVLHIDEQVITAALARAQKVAPTLRRLLDIPPIDRADPNEPGPQTWRGDQA